MLRTRNVSKYVKDRAIPNASEPRLSDRNTAHPQSEFILSFSQVNMIAGCIHCGLGSSRVARPEDFGGMRDGSVSSRHRKPRRVRRYDGPTRTRESAGQSRRSRRDTQMARERPYTPRPIELHALGR